MNELDNEFATAIQLAAIYFGNETRKYATELAAESKWWLSENTLGKNLLRSMQNELQIFEIRITSDVAIVK